MQGHESKLTHNQDWRAIYENHAWIPESETKAGREYRGVQTGILELCGSVKRWSAVMHWFQVVLCFLIQFNQQELNIYMHVSLHTGNLTGQRADSSEKHKHNIKFLTQVLVSMPKCTRMVNKARVVMGVPHVNRSTSESA